MTLGRIFVYHWITYSESPWTCMLNKGITFKDCPMDIGVIALFKSYSLMLISDCWEGDNKHRYTQTLALFYIRLLTKKINFELIVCPIFPFFMMIFPHICPWKSIFRLQIHFFYEYLSNVLSFLLLQNSIRTS